MVTVLRQRQHITLFCDPISVCFHWAMPWTSWTQPFEWHRIVTTASFPFKGQIKTIVSSQWNVRLYCRIIRCPAPQRLFPWKDVRTCTLHISLQRQPVQLRDRLSCRLWIFQSWSKPHSSQRLSSTLEHGCHPALLKLIESCGQAVFWDADTFKILRSSE